LDLPDFNNIVATSLASAPKWLIGYSDVTALHALWNRAGILSIYGPMGSDISAFSQVARDSLFKVIGSGNAVTQTFNGTIRYRGRSSDRTAGRLLGGNLSVLSSMVGSGFLPSYAGAILFVEDTGEAPCEWLLP
jgi:muramoyltetrapeptide carboxypeptidase